MPEDMTFGELPESSYLISKLNELIDVEHHLSSESTGKDFIDLYLTLPPEKKNKLVVIIEQNDKLRAEILGDILHRNASKDKVTYEVGRKRMAVVIIIAIVIMGYSIYSGYAYQREATKVLGDQYDSNIASTIDFVGKIYDLVTNQPDAPDQSNQH